MSNKKKPLFEEQDFGPMGVKQMAEKLEEANKSGETIPAYEEQRRQGSKAWFKDRMGNFTGSKFGDLLKKGRKKDDLWGEVAKKVIMKVAIERDLTEEGIELYIDEMFSKRFRQTEWGNKYESFAITEYMKETKLGVDLTTFTLHESIPHFGSSLDGKIIQPRLTIVEGKEVEQYGIIEVKCPYDVVVHQINVNQVTDGIHPKHDYYPQIQGNIKAVEADFCDFISFDPRRKTNRLAVIRVEKDEEFINNLVKRVLIADLAVYYMTLDVDIEGAILLAEKELQDD